MNMTQKPWISILVLLLAVGVGGGLFYLLSQNVGVISASSLTWGSVALVGLIAVFVVAALVSVAFRLVGLSDQKQALALPEGSVRAIIALSLLVMFSVLSVYLYSDLSQSAEVVYTPMFSKDDAEKFKAKLGDAYFYTEEVKVAVQAEKGTATSGTETKPNTETKYVVYYHKNRSVASEDTAKHLLTMLQTLLTTVVGFYFGARTAASSGQSTDSARPVPAIRSVKPDPDTIVAGSPFKLSVSGDNLNLVKEVKIIQGDKQIVANHVTSNASEVVAEFTAKVATGKWDVMVVDGTGQVAKLPNALSIN
jgi:hypothetical protein